VGEGVEEVVRRRRLGAVGVGLGRGGGPAQALAGRAERQRGGRQLHVERRRRGELERAELLQLPLQAAVLLGERLAAALEELAVHLRLLQLRPRSPVLEPHLHLPWPQVQLLRQRDFLLLRRARKDTPTESEKEEQVQT